MRSNAHRFEGDVLARAGNSLNVVGSDVLARQGDIALIGRDVNITSVTDTSQEREFHEVKQTGLTVTASTPMVSAMQTGARMAKAAGKTDNKVMQGLAVGTTALAASNAYDEVMKDPGSAGGATIQLSLGTSKSSSIAERASASATGSNVIAGGDLTIVAQGGGQASDITVTGSNLSAGRDAVLKAEGDILLQAAKNTFEQHTQNKSSNASVGLSVGASRGNGLGLSVNVAAAAARGHADGQDTGWTYSTVTAGNLLALQSGGDTSLVA